MPPKKTLSRLKDGLKDLFSVSSPSRGATSLPNTRQPSPSPLPQNLPHSVAPLPGATASSARANAGSHLLLSSAGTIPLQAIVATTPGVPPGPVPGSRGLVTAPPAPPGPTQAVASNEETSIERTKSTAWPGLKALLKVVDTSANVFPSLKSAVGGLNQCIEIFERASKGRQDYAELRSKLDSLSKDLKQYLEGPAGLTMTTSLNNLSNGLDEEIKLVQQKYERNTLRRHAEALEDTDEIMECYRRIQGHLERLTLNANINAWRIVDEQATELRLRQLSPTLSAVYNSAESEDVQRKPCTPGTREQELIRLLGWARNKGAGDVYWMNGMAGTGKTTIAYSFCDELSRQMRLGASFFCSRLIPECRNIKLILPALAYQLARFSPPFRYALSQILEADPDVHTRVLNTQFESLLVKPLSLVKNALPMDLVVVIDALDECENGHSVGQILEILLTQTGNNDFPIRFLISSRPELEIYPRMMTRVGQDLKARLVLHDLDAETVKHDIEKYLQTELADVHLTAPQLAALVERSGVLFIYASTAARYIKEGIHALEHEERLDMVLGLSPPAPDGNNQAIDSLYISILGAAFQRKHLSEASRKLTKMILHTVICAQEPMTVSGLADLLRLKSGQKVDALLRSLCSVLNISEKGGLVTILHASFPDFMLDPDRSSMFYCDPKINHGRIAEACFETLEKNKLQFNICKLKSSYLYDDQVIGLTKQVDEAVSPALFYACRNLIAHLALGEQRVDLSELLHDFLSARLLLWMEVLNVKQHIHLGPRIIQRCEEWSRTNDCKKETTELAHDAWRFVTMFASHSVSRSSPHIYLSMLPFWPESAPITHHYTKRMRGAIQTRGTAMLRRQLALLATWSFDEVVKSACFSPDGSLVTFATTSFVNVIDGITGKKVVGPLMHKSTVNSVVFSPDGALIASGSDDKTIRVWNVQNGEMVAGPLMGHTSAVTSVCFSPDGTCIISGSKDCTIRFWGLQDGQTVASPLKCSIWDVYSVCYSPDGTRIASGGEDEALRVWDAKNGKVIFDQLKGHTDYVRSVCFSSDGTRVVSSSDDETIRIWSLQDGQLVAGPLEGHSGYVLSIAFSPNGSSIVSGSRDKTIRLWDLTSDPISARILEGHTGPVTSVAFSSDGSRIVSCSDDKTIRVWDARSRATVTDSIEGHTGAVTSVGYSPDGRHIISGSADKTIRIWDAESGQVVGGPLEGHTDWVRSVCFSPDGKRIVSGSDDRTIRAWDVQSGQKVVGPLEGHTSRVRSICLSPDGALVASGSNDQTIRVWDARNGKPVGSSLRGHQMSVTSVCFSPDSTLIASGSGDKTIIVWDVQSRQIVTGPLGGHTGSILSICFSADSTRIASSSSDKSARVWDAQRGQVILGPLEGHTDTINSVCFSPNGSLLISGSNDKTVRLWDSRNGQAVGDPLVGHTGGVYSVAFSPDGKHIVSGSSDQTIRVWDVHDIRIMYGVPDSLPNLNVAPISPPHLHESWVLREDGWVVNPESCLLAWVPPDLHLPLLRPHNSLAILPKGCCKLNFDSAYLGELWADCYQPLSF